MRLVARYYSQHNQDIGKIIAKISQLHGSVKTVEDLFYKTHGINILLEEAAVDFVIGGCFNRGPTLTPVYRKFCPISSMV
jgi:hypothetical protein